MVSRAAMRELCDAGLDLLDVLQILEEGHPSPRKRKDGTLECWLQRGKKIQEVVVVKDWHEVQQEAVWVVTHYGSFTVRR
jgi:hypothetical protein